jgi:hypothetical protein
VHKLRFLYLKRTPKEIPLHNIFPVGNPTQLRGLIGFDNRPFELEVKFLPALPFRENFSPFGKFFVPKGLGEFFEREILEF